MSSGAVARWVRWALVLLLGSLVMLGAGLGTSSAGGTHAMGPCGESMAMDAAMPAGAAGMAMSGGATPAVAPGQDTNVGSGGADPDGRDCPAPVGLLGMCLGLVAVLVMVGQLLRPALAEVHVERAQPGPGPGRARAVGRFAPRLAQLCVLRV